MKIVWWILGALLGPPLVLVLFAEAPLLAIGVLAYPAYRLTRFILMRRYFTSDEFKTKKAQIAAVVAEHNDVKNYVDEIRNSAKFELGSSSSGAQAHLAEFSNTSKHNYKRDRNLANYAAPNVHQCSLQVVRNAKADPLKYLMKYFDLKATEPNLSKVEELGDGVARLQEAIDNLEARETSITRSLNPPRFIEKHFRDRFMKEVGVELSPVAVPYPKFTFEYVSAGGNSGQKTEIKLNTPTIDALVATMSEKLKFAKSAAGQRALMTAKLRGFIKERDNYTCQSCGVSLADQEHLLLEVDHIVPVSKGGLSSEENLQTLCWRCNRSKSNKIFS